jgi:predicted transcriptional regulator
VPGGLPGLLSAATPAYSISDRKAATIDKPGHFVEDWFAFPCLRLPLQSLAERTPRPPATLPECSFSRIVKGMELHFTPEQEAQLAQLATRAGTDPAHLVMDATLRLLAEDAHFRAAVREGVAQADRGEFIEEDEMDARFEEMLRS